jgi:hypothetical protein
MGVTLTEKVSLGWVALCEDGSANRPTRSNAYNHMFDKENRPRYVGVAPRIYKTEGVAKRYSPVGQAAEAFMEI